MYITHLSDLTALQFLNDTSIDPNAHKLYVYKNPSTQHQEIVTDATKEHHVLSTMQNVMLGTANNYPEQGLNIASYHQKHELSFLTSLSSLPYIETKNVRLLFSSGALVANNIVGHYIKVYCTLQSGKELTLLSTVDLLNDTRAKAITPIYANNKVFTEAIDLSFIDLDHLMYSGNADVEVVRQLMLGTDKPLHITVGYTTLTADSIDNFTTNGLQFTRMSYAMLNTTTIPVVAEQSELIATAKYDVTGYAIVSTLQHTRYTLSDYLANQFINDAYDVSHNITVNSYSAAGTLLDTRYVEMKQHRTNLLEPLTFRPTVFDNADHARILIDVVISDSFTGLSITRQSSLVITSEHVDKFKLRPYTQFNVTNVNAQRIIKKEVHRLVPRKHDIRVVEVSKMI